MKSLRDLYKYGPGPSSSHTIAPLYAARHFLGKINNLDVDHIEVTLYGSLALTGKGHKTDKIITKELEKYPCEVLYDYKSEKPHPNTLGLKALSKDNEILLELDYYSLGGGSLDCNLDHSIREKETYPFDSFESIKSFMKENNYSHLYEVALHFEKDIYEYMCEIFDKMIATVNRGLKASGKIQASNNLFIDKSASTIYKSANKYFTKVGNNEKFISLLTAYAYAVGEENASGEYVVTSPTCGSSGVLPSIIYFLYKNMKIKKEKLVKSLISAGLVGDLFKQNATISGAVGGCQAEIGVAVCMATVALCETFDLGIYQIEYGCELAMEHQLGLTCDPIDGFVVIPCIERNAVGAVRAYEAFMFAKCISLDRRNIVSLDDIINTMLSTGKDLSSSYKETSKAGLANLKK